MGNQNATGIVGEEKAAKEVAEEEKYHIIPQSVKKVDLTEERHTLPEDESKDVDENAADSDTHDSEIEKSPSMEKLTERDIENTDDGEHDPPRFEEVSDDANYTSNKDDDAHMDDQLSPSKGTKLIDSSSQVEGRDSSLDDLNLKTEDHLTIPNEVCEDLPLKESNETREVSSSSFHLIDTNIHLEKKNELEMNENSSSPSEHFLIAQEINHWDQSEMSVEFEAKQDEEKHSVLNVEVGSVEEFIQMSMEIEIGPTRECKFTGTSEEDEGEKAVTSEEDMSETVSTDETGIADVQIQNSCEQPCTNENINETSTDAPGQEYEGEKAVTSEEYLSEAVSIDEIGIADVQIHKSCEQPRTHENINETSTDAPIEEDEGEKAVASEEYLSETVSTDETSIAGVQIHNSCEPPCTDENVDDTSTDGYLVDDNRNQETNELPKGGLSNSLELKKSPSFEFGISFEESDQTPLLYQDKAAIRSFSTSATLVRSFLQNDREDKTVDVMGRSNSENSRAQFPNMIKKDREKAILMCREEKQENQNVDDNGDKDLQAMESKEFGLDSPKVNAKRRTKSSLFTTCICCTAAIS